MHTGITFSAYWWYSVKLWYLQCISTGDTSVLYQAINMHFNYLLFTVSQLQCIRNKIMGFFCTYPSLSWISSITISRSTIEDVMIWRHSYVYCILLTISWASIDQARTQFPGQLWWSSTAFTIHYFWYHCSELWPLLLTWFNFDPSMDK